MQTRLPFFAIVRVSGEDRTAFIHGQPSNDINHLAEGSACYATYNTPKGRVLANMLVLNRGSDLLLVMAADLTEAIAKRLRMLILRAKVVFEPLPDYTVVAVLDENTEAYTAAEPPLFFSAAERDGVWTVSLPHTGRLKIGEAEHLSGHDATAENAWDLHEIRGGYTWISAATREIVIAQMFNQHIIGGMHSKKGCYPGQEVIVRAQYRGQIKRGLAVLSGGSLEAAGIAVLENGVETGQIINTALTDAGSLNFAVIKHAAVQTVLTDVDGNSLKQEKLFFNIEPKE